MKKWIAAALVALLAAAAPLFAPQAWAQHGAFPDVAAIAVLYLAICGTPERAAVLGVSIGLLRSAFTPEPLGLDAALYGALGWSGAHFGRAVFDDRAFVKILAAGLGVVALRLFGYALAPLAPGMGSAGGVSAATLFRSMLWAALATAAASPVVFAALRGSHVLAGFERRRRHDV